MGNKKSTPATTLDKSNQQTQPKISRSPTPPKPGSYTDLEYKDERQNSQEITHGMCVYVIYMRLLTLCLPISLFVYRLLCLFLSPCVCVILYMTPV